MHPAHACKLQLQNSSLGSRVPWGLGMLGRGHLATVPRHAAAVVWRAVLSRPNLDASAQGSGDVVAWMRDSVADARVRRVPLTRVMLR